MTLQILLALTKAHHFSKHAHKYNVQTTVDCMFRVVREALSPFISEDTASLFPSARIHE